MVACKSPATSNDLLVRLGILCSQSDGLKGDAQVVVLVLLHLVLQHHNYQVADSFLFKYVINWDGKLPPFMSSWLQISKAGSAVIWVITPVPELGETMFGRQLGVFDITIIYRQTSLHVFENFDIDLIPI